ncbi:MAG: hypothetical protein V4513_00680 [Pseudomonadota bacterium]
MALRRQIKTKIPKFLQGSAQSASRAANYLLAREPEFAIVGTGRSGTTFTAEYLNHIGIPCSHEKYFTSEGPTLRNARRPFYSRGDASWMAVPYVTQMGIPVVHQIRNPIAVIRSLMRIQFFDPAARDHHGEFIRFALRHFRATDDQLGNCIRWYIDWNRRCEDVSSFRFRVEDFDPAIAEIFAKLGYSPSPDKADVSEQLNSRASPTGHNLSDKFEEELRAHRHFDELQELSEKYGYSLVNEINKP